MEPSAFGKNHYCLHSCCSRSLFCIFHLSVLPSGLGSMHDPAVDGLPGQLPADGRAPCSFLSAFVTSRQSGVRAQVQQRTAIAVTPS